MTRFPRAFIPVLDFFATPFVYPAAWLLRSVRAIGVNRLPSCRRALLDAGVFPIRNHYYEPQFDLLRAGYRPASQERALPGIDWNTDEQLRLLDAMTFAGELADTPAESHDPLRFHLNNLSFGSGDAEFWYQLVRLKKPRRIFEIGSGSSTLLAVQAIRANQAEDSQYACQHVCIEPYENAWLSRLPVSLLRRRVEDVEIAFFAALEHDDVLFIDSSHVIRSEGDVLFEYLQLLPTLKPGVIVHVHDIFSPRNYPDTWRAEQVLFWNEQYLVEAFLSHNSQWRIIAALNYLRHHHFDRLRRVAPFLRPDRDPGSFYIQRCG